MIQFDVREMERSLVLTVLGIDVKAASAMLDGRLQVRSETLPRVQLEVGEEAQVRFYPDLIRISFNPDRTFDQPIAQYQTLKFDEMMGKEEPIIVKKRDERMARLERVRYALQNFMEEMEANTRGAS